MTMSLGAGRLDDMRRRSSVTKLETSTTNNNISSLDGTDLHPGRYAVCSMWPGQHWIAVKRLSRNLARSWFFLWLSCMNCGVLKCTALAFRTC